MNTKTDISAAYVGSTGVDKLYLGNEVVWQNTPPGPVPYEEQNLTFNITSPGTIRFGKVSPSTAIAANDAPTVTIYYKVNSGNWTEITTTTAGTEFNVVSGDTVQFKGDNAYYGYSSVEALRSDVGNSFSGSTATFNIQGNIMSLIDSQNFATIDQTWVDSAHTAAFIFMFRNTNVEDASNLVLQPSGATQDLISKAIFSNMFRNCPSLHATPKLPATSMENYCYSNMFYGCSALMQAPALPATTLATNCYSNMFNGCTSLTTATVLPATTLAASCYLSMFQGCSGLTQAPALPATTLAVGCYNSMFRNCTSLTQASALPATTLAINCYSNMFVGCTSLTTSPELLATTLANNCYAGMFSGCTSLNTITCIASINGTSYTNNWVKNVAATGTFYKDANATGWTRGANGIPSGWTAQNYDPSTPVLKIAGQSIPGPGEHYFDYEWYDLSQYSGTSFTIEVGGVPITADTWSYAEDYKDMCGNESQISYDDGTTRSVFAVNSGYVGWVVYYPDSNTVDYESIDDHTGDGTEQEICENCDGRCWDEENHECHICPDPCDDWEGAGYGSYEECTCAERGENCPEEESGE